MTVKADVILLLSPPTDVALPSARQQIEESGPLTFTRALPVAHGPFHPFSKKLPGHCEISVDLISDSLITVSPETPDRDLPNALFVLWPPQKPRITRHSSQTKLKWCLLQKCANPSKNATEKEDDSLFQNQRHATRLHP